MTVTIKETAAWLMRSMEVDFLERLLTLEPCCTDDCDEVAVWRWTTLPCGCLTYRCDDCLAVLKHRYDDDRARCLAFAPLTHIPCGLTFPAFQLNYTITRI